MNKLELIKFIDKQCESIRRQVEHNRVLLGLSGGVDSSVTAALINKAIGEQLTSIYVDNGLMRKNETTEIEEQFADAKMKFIVVNAQQDFLRELKGKTEPEEKRKIIGTQFYQTFWDQARDLGFGEKDFFAQGTNKADVVESVNKIKTHHNLVKMPDDIKFAGLVEPLRDLYKDEVRRLGRVLGLSTELVDRQPFPGPGLGIRVIGEITEEKLAVLREADAIFRATLKEDKIQPSQYFVALSNDKAVGMNEGKRVDGNLFYLRALDTQNFMEATPTKIPYKTLDKVTERIFDNVPNTARVLYDLSPKRKEGACGTMEYL